MEPVTNEDEEIESPVWLTDPSETPEYTIERGELSNAIQNCLNDLDFEFKTIVILVDVQGMNYSEAAEAVSKPLGTVKSRLARARIKMQDCLRGFGELLPSSFRLESEGIN